MTRIIIMDEKYLQELKAEIAKAVIIALQSKNGSLNKNQLASEWVDDVEAKKILGYRSKTRMQDLRSSGAIVYSKYGRKIKYFRQSLIEFIEKNKRINAFNNGSK